MNAKILFLIASSLLSLFLGVAVYGWDVYSVYDPKKGYCRKPFWPSIRPSIMILSGLWSFCFFIAACATT